MNSTEKNYLGHVIDCSEDFSSVSNTFFNISEMNTFEEKSMTGSVSFKRYRRKERLSFNGISYPYEESASWTFPPDYEESPSHKISLSFYDSNIFRLQVNLDNTAPQKETSVMLEKELKAYPCKTAREKNSLVLTTDKLKITITSCPFTLEIRDSCGNLLTRSIHMDDSRCLLNYNPLPFSYVKRASDLKKTAAASFSISPGEHFYGCGESFTGLDKLGQKVVLWTKDPHGVQTQEMYKPIPFYMSSKGYGIFTHTSAPVTFDFGSRYREAQTIFIGNEKIDLFFIAGTPKEILTGYTFLTGRANMPPLWSFGLWMSRISYQSEEEVMETAGKLRDYRIPCDVLHLDTGWFEKDWRCNYQFSPTRFPNPQKLINSLKENGFHVSLWQLPYFTPGNELYREIVDNGYAVQDFDGNLPADDAILDFSNKHAAAWYQNKLRPLLEMGVAAIKADFGEAAPLHGKYASGKSGITEHNLYPLRYNKAVSDITKQIKGESIIWARSAWAGSQRYPLHWGGDAENTNMGMLSTLRGGLSLGMCGFTFWSHDAGGFVRKSPEELYKRWMFMSVFSSHMRCHGAPPKEPWHYSEEFLALFRKQVEFRYRLIPYIYEESRKSAEKGWPMMRSMFFEYPDDNTCIGLDDQYMFGSSILAAPLFEDNISQRSVYLPKGLWVDLENKDNVYEGGHWHSLPSGSLCGIALVKKGAGIPMSEVIQHTGQLQSDRITINQY
ncbi:glycoside hydrolase family 31 protein [Anaerocolumna xylanovorans]|uniref:Alpha-D-xyloside xylohydrolase n=1 Tax=Anaerocolumna xylanovorans DSM 12503 TaxID=1121345 RepID=A0A1M7YHQ0_9FIRM|nr:TIM-barrel domain-containing protein [Anaerocolumna xylanovorans]SHO52133.1 alpha-D-xyloside xylohydrolase [Anaerocolumna xylanovorans DSM 12503]